MRNYIYITLSFIVLGYTTAIAQVTIGSDILPRPGAILDLTQGATTTKGLLLPRVKLTDLSSMVDIVPREINRPSPASHIGLMIYNMSTEGECVNIPPGVYTWAGIKWQRAGIYKQPSKLASLSQPSTTISFHTDQEGQMFVAGDFGDAGVWMLHNLAVTKYADNSPITLFSVGDDNTQAHYTYPSSTQKETFRIENGYLYNWEAIIKDEPIASKHQGICPNGWHLPTSEDWDKLSKVVYESDNYSFTSNSATPLWSNAWTGVTGYIASEINGASSTAQDPAITKIGLGTLLKDMCKLDFKNNISPMGLSKQMRDKGLNFELNGFVASDGNHYNYSQMGYFWSVTPIATTTSNLESRYAQSRYVSAYESGIGRNTSSKLDLLSVRCIQRK